MSVDVDYWVSQVAERDERINRLTHPVIYTGTHYANVSVPERCPDCDGRDFISHGVSSVICKSCWLTAELDKVEAQNRQLREALKECRIVLVIDHGYMDESKSVIDIDAALAATEPKE